MQIIYLDISNKGVYPCVQAKQNEVGRKFLAVIIDNGIPYQLPQNALMSVWYSGDNGNGNYSSIDERSAFSVDGNKISVELISKMLQNHGKGELCLTITHGDGREISSWNIEYCVEEKPGAGRSIPEDYYTALTEAGAVAAKAVTEAQGIIVDAKNAVKLAENAVAKAENATSEANDATKKAENVIIANSNKQDKLSWVTEEDIEAMIAGTYVGSEEDNPDPEYVPNGYRIADILTGEKYNLYVDGGNLKMEVRE